MRDDERESLRLKISMAKTMLANLGADVPRRDTVVAAMKEIIADAENQLADASDDDGTKSGAAWADAERAASPLHPTSNLDDS
jgi:hypothetical protein